MRAPLLVVGLVLALTACSGTEAATPTAPAAVPLEAPSESSSPTPSPTPSELKMGATQVSDYEDADGKLALKVTALRIR
jgi:hypothetical protein